MAVLDSEKYPAIGQFKKRHNRKPLGFGCSALQTGLDLQRSKRLLFGALDVGISYFDTAPRYAFSEQFLGKYLPKLDSITLATKVGLDPLIKYTTSLFLDQTKQRTKAWLKSYGKNTDRKNPRVKLSFETPVHPVAIYSKQCFDKSVQLSLKNLRRDNLDILFIHEPERIINLQELIAWAGNLRSQGIVRSIGLAPHRIGVNLTDCCKWEPELIWQFAWRHRKLYEAKRRAEHVIFGASPMLYHSEGIQLLDQELANYPASTFLVRTNNPKHLDWIDQV